MIYLYICLIIAFLVLLHILIKRTVIYYSNKWADKKINERDKWWREFKKGSNGRTL